VKRIVRRGVEKWREFLLAPMASALRGYQKDNQRELMALTEQVQLLLAMQFREMVRRGERLSLAEVGFRGTSQADEDGILHFLFSVAGTTDRRVVEIGSATVEGSNTANLILHHGWTGLLIDADEAKAERLRRFYEFCPATRLYPPKVVARRVTVDNVNEVLETHGFRGDIDLFCLDIDGVDYWVWKALEVVRPRVVVVEYQCVWGPDRAVTVPYRPDFKAECVGEFAVYSGASLAAFVKLGRAKGYRLVGCQRYGFNAFFVRSDVGPGLLDEASAADCFRHPFTRWAMEKFLPLVKDREWIEV
jgi:hypothetical protein